MIFNEQGFIDIDEMIALALAEQAIAGDHQHLPAALRPTEPPSSVRNAERSWGVQL